MNKLKVILMGLGLIFAVVLLYFAVNLVIGLAGYALLIGAVAGVGYLGYKYLSKPETVRPQLEADKETRMLNEADKVLSDYRRKMLDKK